jgi:hypothetical protein
MVLRFFVCCVLAGMVHLHVQGSASAQESPLVPPWGRDLPPAESAPSPAISELPAEHSTETSAHGAWRFVGEYLLWWTKNGRVPPLLTTGPTSDARPGALDQPFTKLLYGDNIDFQERHGGRFTLEVPLGNADEWSVAANYFLLTSRNVGLTLSSPGNPVLARPFLDAVNLREDSSVVTFPGVASGSVAIRSDSFLHGAEANLQCVWWHCDSCRITLLAGFRYLGLYENTTIAEDSLIDPAAGKVDPTLTTLAGHHVSVQDRFQANNDFCGGQIGADIELRYRRWIFNLIPKVAFGGVHEVVAIRGHTVIDTAPAIDEPAGLLALATNSGRFSRNDFAIVPEISAKLGLRITERLTLFGGYGFMYWSNVVRPGDQIDRRLNPNLIPTSATFGGPAAPALPAAPFRTTDYWAQGMMWGLEFRY